MPPPDSAPAGENLNIELIRHGLSAEIVGGRLCIFWEVPSTNAVLRQMADAGAAEGTVVLAEAQTEGRGRRGQRWFSPPGVNLYASVLFRPRIAPAEVPGFSFIASLAVTDAIRLEGLWGGIKWPNDVLVDGKKLAGTLVDCASAGDTVEWVILGVGINLNVGRDELRKELGAGAHAATSLRDAAGRAIDRSAFTGAFLTALDRWFRVYTAEGVGPILAAWRDRDILTSRRVEVRNGHGTVDGRVRGVDAGGALVVEDSLGATHRVVGGEIRFAD
jgi:BirA family biotin operon repressor/biotin-[acetyl-CoA-carboxylase] ligase